MILHKLATTFMNINEKVPWYSGNKLLMNNSNQNLLGNSLNANIWKKKKTTFLLNLGLTSDTEPIQSKLATTKN